MMPAIDVIHTKVKQALIKDGWIITADPLVLSYGERKLFIDIGAEKLIEATKGNRKIAVEIKSFTGPSPIADVQEALGQYLMYKAILDEEDVNRELYLALSNSFHDSFFQEPLGQLLITKYRPNMIVLDLEKEEIVAWLP